MTELVDLSVIDAVKMATDPARIHGMAGGREPHSGLAGGAPSSTTVSIKKTIVGGNVVYSRP